LTTSAVFRDLGSGNLFAHPCLLRSVGKTSLMNRYCKNFFSKQV
jgi:hypothetical protein